MMNVRKEKNLKFQGVTTFKMLGVVVLAGSLLSVWPGCKDGSTNSVPAPRGDAAVVRPVALEAVAVNVPAAPDNPLTAGIWKNAQWVTLTKTSSGRTHGTFTKVAALFTKTNLYVAIVATGPYHADAAAAPDNLWRHDCTEIWLDTSRQQNGTNFFELVVSPTGETHGVWHRSSTAPTPGPGGQPNLDHPYSLIPWQVASWIVKTGAGTWHGQHAATAVVEISLSGLPRPLRFNAKVGGRFRINILRYVWRRAASGHRQLTQYSLFRVPPEAQAFAPYLMGRLALISSNDTNLALRP
ncbi:MAG: sugar-binding protein [Phycisphaerae bacterium]